MFVGELSKLPVGKKLIAMTIAPDRATINADAARANSTTGPEEPLSYMEHNVNI